MRGFIITTEWPRFEGDISGIHVVNQIKSLKQAGLSVDVFSFRGHKNPLSYWNASREFRKINLSQYDIIHAHHGQSGIVALSQYQRPVVVTFHGSDLQGIRDLRGRVTPLGYMLRFSSRWVASRATEVILVSQNLAHYLPKRILYQIIPAGMDLNLFRPIPMTEARTALGFPLDTRLVLFIGNPERTEKRFWLAQKATNIIRDALVVQLVVANNLVLEQIPLYMNACNVLVVTSSSEGSPNVVKEALACNLPIVSTDVGDVRQRIGSIDGCIVCDNDDPETIAFALKQVLARNERICGRKTVSDLDENLLTKKVIAVYEKALSK